MVQGRERERDLILSGFHSVFGLLELIRGFRVKIWPRDMRLMAHENITVLLVLSRLPTFRYDGIELKMQRESDCEQS